MKKREAVGYEPVKGGDEILQPSTMLPLNIDVGGEKPPEQEEDGMPEQPQDVERGDE